MHPSQDVSRDRFLRQHAQRANHFSFPPTQRYGLLGPTTATRSSDQRANLARSYRRLLDVLNVSVPQQAGA